MVRACGVAASLALLALVLVPQPSSATVGVGVGAGKITLQAPVAPGGVYQLPPIPVLNTGDEPSDYGMSVEFNETQPQLKPVRDWFSFSPTLFRLEPKASQIVSITLTLPLKTVPGEYFVYLEAHPVKVDVSGVTAVNIAAATKLSFTVKPANIFQGAYYRVASFVARYSPWSYVVLGVLAAAILLVILRRFVSFNIGISVRKK